MEDSLPSVQMLAKLLQTQECPTAWHGALGWNVYGLAMTAIAVVVAVPAPGATGTIGCEGTGGEEQDKGGDNKLFHKNSCCVGCRSGRGSLPWSKNLFGDGTC
jgi:hypothetical protein